MKYLVAITALVFLAPPVSAARVTCADGTANGFPCSHIDFVAQLSPAALGGSGEVLNDIWGWVDPLNGAEYALVGMQDGTAFVRLHGDGEPEYLGRLRASDGRSSILKSQRKNCHDECGGAESAWRDVKVYSNAALDQHYAYVVSEAEGHGVQIFDLRQLRDLDGDVPNDNLPEAAHYAGVGHAHNLFINEATARAYVVGHDGPDVAGGLHVLDISTPTNPRFLAELNGDGYTHDVQCVVYEGPDDDILPNSELCFASNEDTLTVWDVTDVNATDRENGAEVLSRTSYPHSGYVHQGWLSDDQRHFFVNDELDEQALGMRTHLRVFDVSDVHAPQLAAHYYAPTHAIDHNNYVHGRWLLQSNYEAGLRILDVLDPEHPVEAAYFDPQATDLPRFQGTWSNFAFPSGLVAFTDINDGLFVVRPTLEEAGSAPDLSLSMVLSTTHAAPDEDVEGSVTLSAGDVADADDLLLTLHVPGGAVFSVVPQVEGWSCTPSIDARVVECRRDALAAGSEAAFPFTITAGPGALMEVIAMVYAKQADAAPADNLASASFLNEEGDDTPPGSGDGGGGGALLWLLAGCALRARALRR